MNLIFFIALSKSLEVFISQALGTTEWKQLVKVMRFAVLGVGHAEALGSLRSAMPESALAVLRSF